MTAGLNAVGWLLTGLLLLTPVTVGERMAGFLLCGLMIVGNVVAACLPHHWNWEEGMRVEFVVAADMPQNKLADAELYFESGEPLAGLKLVGFSVWRGERGDFVTVPARAFGKGKDRAYFDFLRCSDTNDKKPVFRLKDFILKEWRNGRGRATVQKGS